MSGAVSRAAGTVGPQEGISASLEGLAPPLAKPYSEG